MGSYLQQYGESDEKRNRVLKWLVGSIVGVLLVLVLAYLIFENYPERQKAKRFLAEINARNYPAAYREWGCTHEHPCPNYDYNRFLEDWTASKKTNGPWTIASFDSCRTFLTVNVKAPGTDPESLSVMRSDNSLGYAPAPECQERKWRWKQFFQRFFSEPPPPSRPPA